MKQSLIFAIVATVIVITLLFLLATLNAKTYSHKNGFTRKFGYYKIEQLNALKTGKPYYRIVGASAGRLYLNGLDPHQVFVTNMQLSDLDTLTLKLTMTKQLIVAYDIQLDSPWLYIFENNLRTIKYYNLNTSTFSPLNPKTQLFTRGVPISRQSIVLRTFDTINHSQIFEKIDQLTGTVTKANTIIEGQEDAGFSTDGLLKYDKASNSLVYMQYYQNKFYKLDTNLNLIYAGKTIDTINFNPVNTKQISSGEMGSLMPSTPLRATNKDFTIGSEHIFILSDLKAENESNDSNSRNSTVDSYNLEDGKYTGSFYIPGINSQKIKYLRIFDNILVTLSTDYISTYRLGFVQNIGVLSAQSKPTIRHIFNSIQNGARFF